ncbi:MAG: DUF1732 domain-containing protein [Candidatus Omnitrophota bacterium]
MRSMTAYASFRKNKGGQSVNIVLRSVNYKYLDVSIHNLPIESILLEEAIKREIKKRIQRGKIEVFIFSSKPQAKKVCVNQKTIAEYISQVKDLARKHNIRSEISLTDILNLPQSVTWEPQGETGESLILPALKQALDKLINFKEKEGRVIEKEIRANVAKLKSNMEETRRQKPKASKVENGKEDIDEELSLSAFYIGKLETKISLKKNAPIGKSIDFLTQEILRELNAASSKTKKETPAFLIVEAKSYIERIREQAQNIE